VAGPRTWAVLGKKLGYSIYAVPSLDGVPLWARNLLLNNPAATVPTHINVDTALTLFEKLCAHLSPSQRAGLSFLIGKLDKDPAITDVRWAAYMLATVRHECGGTWQPIEEDPQLWTGKAYAAPVVVTDAAGTAHTNRYYGRGFVQLTHKQNYATMSANLGLGDQLVIYPEKALDPEIAYNIMSYGMRNGSFRNKALRDFISASKCDYCGARDIINAPTDFPDRIEGYARDLELVLLGAIPAMFAFLPMKVGIISR
jgi:hypothetical protein